MSPFVVGKFEESIKLTNTVIEYINTKQYLKLHEIFSNTCIIDGIEEVISGKDASIKAIQDYTNESRIVVSDIYNFKAKCIVKFTINSTEINTTKKLLAIIESKEGKIQNINVYSKMN